VRALCKPTTTRSIPAPGSSSFFEFRSGLMRPIAPSVLAWLDRMVDGDTARRIEERLAAEVEDVRDWVKGNIGESGNRRTDYRFIRGTHGVQYVRVCNRGQVSFAAPPWS